MWVFFCSQNTGINWNCTSGWIFIWQTPQLNIMIALKSDQDYRYCSPVAAGNLVWSCTAFPAATRLHKCTFIVISIYLMKTTYAWNAHTPKLLFNIDEISVLNVFLDIFYSSWFTCIPLINSDSASVTDLFLQILASDFPTWLSTHVGCEQAQR